MKLIRFAAGSMISVSSLIAALGVTAGTAHAQATRTWVSGDGDDINPCSRSAPCKTFAGAISKTAAGGEIDCLDPGGYGTLTITKSITIDCTGTFGSVLNSGGINGFVINDSATATPGGAVVILRGLSIDGAGTTPGLNAIRFISGRSIFIENVMIEHQENGNGISFQPSHTGAKLHLNNVSITGGNNGLLIQPTGAAGSADVTLSNIRVQANAGVGLKVDSTGNTNTSGITVNITDSHFDGNGDGISAINAGGTNPVAIMIDRSTLNSNAGAGLIGNGSSMMIRVSNTTITGNVLGLIAFGGAVVSTYGNNRVIGNPTNGVPNNGSFTNAIISQ
jgi:hypothetical protein